MNIDRSKIMKALSILAALFICVFGLTQILEHNSQTLTEYAEENPAPPKPEENETIEETAANGKENASATGEIDSGLPDETESDTETSEDVTENLQNEEELPPHSTLTGALLNGESMADTRVTYADSFYYEPLSDNLKRYITGVSFPAVAQAKDAMSETNPAEETVVSEGLEVATKEEELAVSYDELRYLHILHYDFEGNLAEGELICNEYIAQDLVEIFYELYRNEYQIESVLLIDEFDGDDTASMEANNTSCFNYRVVEGSTSLSKHALGLALDINPLYNPYITYNDDGSENVSPEGGTEYADRSVNFPYKIDENDLCYKLFTEHGFIWGGNWNSCKDYQHFQKVIEQ